MQSKKLDKQYRKMLFGDLSMYLNASDSTEGVKPRLKIANKIFSLILKNWDFFEKKHSEAKYVRLINTILAKCEQLVSEINNHSKKYGNTKRLLYKIFQCREKCLIFLDIHDMPELEDIPEDMPELEDIPEDMPELEDIPEDNSIDLMNCMIYLK